MRTPLPSSVRIVAATVVAATLVATLTACGRKGEDTASAPAAGTSPVAAVVASPTIKAIRARDSLLCGVNPGLAGFSYRDNRGSWRGFDVDFCRAVASVVLGDPAKVRFVPVDNAGRIAALKDGRIDLLARNTSWTFSRDVADGVDFAGVSYYDGQGFLAPRTLNLQSATELGGAKVCVQGDSTSQLNLADYFRSRGLNYTPVIVADEAKAREVYQAEGCDAFSADVSALAAARSVLNNPDGQVILPDVISKEPLSPGVRQGDPAWTDLVRWTLNALILAEELNVYAANAEAMRRESTNPEVRRLLGAEPGFGKALGLDDAWALRTIKAVGNYGEIFDRNVGSRSPLKLERGLNARWDAAKPGLLYAPPLR
jgi:general L-amino acid transport system substrate-binding protein